MKEKNKLVTIYDIAKECKVSPATVSRVLTNSAKVSFEKKNKIIEVIRKYDFEPNWIARSLSNQYTRTIGMIIPDIRNPFYSNFFIECEMVAMKEGFHIILFNTLNNMDHEYDLLKNMCEKKVEAVILVGGCVDEVILQERFCKLVNRISNQIHVIATGELLGVTDNIYRIISSKDHGMNEIVRYLKEQGHRKIAIIGGRGGVIPTKRKREKLLELCENEKISLLDPWIIDSEYNIEGGYKAGKNILLCKELPTASILINDICAIGYIRSLEEEGYRIPQDMSVISYDNTYLSEAIQPRITSVDYELGIYALTIIRTVILLLKGEKVEKEQIIKPRLHFRNSVINIEQ